MQRTQRETGHILCTQGASCLDQGMRMDMKATSFRECPQIHCVSLARHGPSLVTQRIPKIPPSPARPPDAALAPAHERLVLTASIILLSRSTEALAGPDLSGWPAQASDFPGSLQGSTLPGAGEGRARRWLKPAAPQRPRCSANPWVTGTFCEIGQTWGRGSQQTHRPAKGLRMELWTYLWTPLHS